MWKMTAVERKWWYMSRQHKIAIVIFCVGVLLCGIGAGVAFTEFGALSFGGRQILGETDMRTTEIDVAFVPKEDEKTLIVGARAAYAAGIGQVCTDASVPPGTVRFQVTYNGKRVEPFADYEESSNEDTFDRIVFSWYWRGTEDETALMMAAKDIVLQNLKEGKIVSLDTVDVEKVTVLVNPKNEDDVRIVY